MKNTRRKRQRKQKGGGFISKKLTDSMRRFKGLKIGSKKKQSLLSFFKRKGPPVSEQRGEGKMAEETTHVTNPINVDTSGLLADSPANPSANPSAGLPANPSADSSADLVANEVKNPDRLVGGSRRVTRGRRRVTRGRRRVKRRSKRRKNTTNCTSR